jgi:type VI secretion system secreted protein Hcp
MAVDVYLKLDTIEGESVRKGFEKQIDILSYSWGGTQVTGVAGTGGSGAGRANLSDLSVSKYLDKASPKMFKALIAGTHLATGTLSSVKAGTDVTKPFLTLTLGELFITSQQISASSETPVESVSFSYNTIKVEYFQQDDKGNLTSTGAVSYNLKQNAIS